MKKTIALMLALLMLCTASVALAEEDGKLEPLFATVGDALAAAGENPIAGGEEDYYAVITEQDGKYYRSVAELDDKAKALEQAILEADIDHMEEAFAARDEYLITLPIAYSEMFTVEPMTEAEMDDLVGQTIEELREAGYELGNCDITICAQAPKLNPNIDAMQACLAQVMEVNPNQVSIKATTTEHLGFVGRQEGIAAYAVALITQSDR